MEFSGQHGDFMQIEFRGGDKLYVPMDRLHWVSRYQAHRPGAQARQPRLGQRWQTASMAQKKVTDAVWKIAQELLDIYAQRALRQGHRFSPAGDLYRELEESFPYDETSGQAKAIDEVLDDLTREQPMDRLVCGDVGYGKTEVAARGAFKVIEDGWQVAVLVPTTVLAEQHAATFRERFAGFPVEIACLNRFRTARGAAGDRGRAGERHHRPGVGTHRLLSKDIRFNRLGLLIVDEEHRFGVAHKERSKSSRPRWTCSPSRPRPSRGTPADVALGHPRPVGDLHPAAPAPLGQDLPGPLRPAGHHPRGHPAGRWSAAASCSSCTTRVQSTSPGGRDHRHPRSPGAHRRGPGQMPGPQPEDIMVRFINHEIDILVCTTIIESGLDIANANTIIINRADNLGLADIYQLRGRVGRSSRQAYAYLLVPSLDHLTADAQQRLRALMDCSELGGGFKLAMNDLQIRGGGNLLGVSQSGHIAAVGYDLYLELQSTRADLKSKAAAGGLKDGLTTSDLEIKLQVAAFLPDSYIPDTSLRYHAYRRLAAAGTGSAADLADPRRTNWSTVTALLPPEAQALFALIGLRSCARSASPSSNRPRAAWSSPSSTEPRWTQRLLALVQENRRGSRPPRLPA